MWGTTAIRFPDDGRLVLYGKPFSNCSMEKWTRRALDLLSMTGGGHLMDASVCLCVCGVAAGGGGGQSSRKMMARLPVSPRSMECENRGAGPAAETLPRTDQLISRDVIYRLRTFVIYCSAYIGGLRRAISASAIQNFERHATVEFWNAGGICTHRTQECPPVMLGVIYNVRITKHMFNCWFAGVECD